MYKVFQYYGRYQDLRGSVGQLPSWARLLVGLAAVPGLMLVGLSILAFGVSILALLVLTMPVYRLVCMLTGVRQDVSSGAGPVVQTVEAVEVETESVVSSPQVRRQIDVKIVE